jgi:hypothetical protein
LLLPAATLVLALRSQRQPPRWWWWLLGGSLVLLTIEYVPVVALLPELPLLIFAHIWPTSAVISQLETVEGAFPTLGVLLFAVGQALLLVWSRTEERTVTANHG